MVNIVETVNKSIYKNILEVRRRIILLCDLMHLSTDCLLLSLWKSQSLSSLDTEDEVGVLKGLKQNCLIKLSAMM